MDRSSLRERLKGAEMVPRGGAPLHEVAAQFSSDTKYVFSRGVSRNVPTLCCHHVGGCSCAVGSACKCLVTAPTRWRAP